MSADLDALKERIRALQARTTARGCTEAEAAAAAAAVAQLMEKHGLSEADVQTGTLFAAVTRAPAETDVLWPAVARLCRCSFYYEVGNGRRAAYIGRLPFPELAVWLHGVLTGAAARASRDFAKSAASRKRRTRKTKAAARAAFMTAFAIRLRHRLWDLRTDGDDVRADLALAEDAMKRLGPMGTAKKPKLSASTKYSDAQVAGWQAAEGVNLGWGINGPAATRALTGPR